LTWEYLREFSKKLETVLMGYSGAGGKLIMKKTRTKKFRDTVPLKEPRNLIVAWQAVTTTLFDVPAPHRLHRLAESIPGLLNRLQIWALNKFPETG
jgi:hypothetical protein